jgi:hypothetical protein
MPPQSLQFRPDRLPQRTVPRPAVATSISPTLKLIALVIFLPDELSFYISEFRLTLIRALIFLLTPVLLVQFSKLLASRKCHLVFSDILIALTGLWMIVSPALVVDLEYSLHHSAPLAVEFCGSYIAGRVLLSEHGQALNFINFLCHVIAIVALLGALDALTGTLLINNIVRQLLGLPMLTPGGGVLEFRLGILRSMGPIGHPILFGIVCAVGLILAVGSPIRSKGLTIAACGVGLLLSMSSAPIEGAVLGFGFLAYDSGLARFRGRWMLLICSVALGYGALFMFTPSPLSYLFGYVNLDPTSYWVRVVQWNEAGAVVLNSPWIGIAFQWPEIVARMPYFVQVSIDSLWLNLALIYGIPGSVLVGLSMLGAACYRTNGCGVNLTREESKLATTLSILIVVIVLLGFTVYIWEGPWMLVGLLVGARAHLADLASQRSAAARQRNSLSFSRRQMGPDDSP